MDDNEIIFVFDNIFTICENPLGPISFEEISRSFRTLFSDNAFAICSIPLSPMKFPFIESVIKDEFFFNP